MSARADVRIYLTSWCPFCVRAKQLLRDKGVSFSEVDVDGRQDLRRWLASATGQRTVPQVFVNGAPLGGFSDIDALDEEGKLDPLLAEAPRPGTAPLPD
jgi:glutaredoxin 3